MRRLPMKYFWSWGWVYPRWVLMKLRPVLMGLIEAVVEEEQ